VRIAIVVALSQAFAIAGQLPRFPASLENLLLKAKCSGNLESYGKGLRGAPDHMVYDFQRRRFLRPSRWHEYGVGFGQKIGVVREQEPAWWMARWPGPVKANLIVLSGVYPNQPQPQTCWKIETRSGGKWRALARGQGGWYDRGRFVWDHRDGEPLEFDAIRVCLFSKDARTPLASIHFRGEEGISWLVAFAAPLDARIVAPKGIVRAGQPCAFEARRVLGKIVSWRWEFGDGTSAQGQKVNHVYQKPGSYELRLAISDGKHTATLVEAIEVELPVEARIEPLAEPVVVGTPVAFSGEPSVGKVKTWRWDFGDGTSAEGEQVRHAFARPGIYRVRLTVGDGVYEHTSWAIVRAHTQATLHIPQLFLDTDQKNEVDDQHYFSYALFSRFDILGINSIHHGGGQEPTNYREILHIRDLALASGLPKERVPFVFHGANRRLAVPEGRRWDETEPIVTEASEAILAAVRGASPRKPVWVLPVGPLTNVASAILTARRRGLELNQRMKVVWLGGSRDAIGGEFNGNNDPWAGYVVGKSGVEFWIIPAYVGGRVRLDVRTEGYRYPKNPLGEYLRRIVPRRNKSLYDPTAISTVLAFHLGLGWVKRFEYVTFEDPTPPYRWKVSREATSTRVIREIDQEQMKEDLFSTLRGKPRPLVGRGGSAP